MVLVFVVVESQSPFSALFFVGQPEEINMPKKRNKFIPTQTLNIWCIYLHLPPLKCPQMSVHRPFPNWISCKIYLCFGDVLTDFFHPMGELITMKLSTTFWEKMFFKCFFVASKSRKSKKEGALTHYGSMGRTVCLPTFTIKSTECW